MASSSVREDKYRPFMREDSEKNIKWRYGAPPNYDVVNKLFDEGRTKVWPPGSLEEKKLRPYNPYEETADSSHKAFTTTFPRGFALEILHVYSGPPVIVYKFRHWGYMEGPFKGHAPTGDKIEVYGMAIFTLDENSKIVKVEFFYDPAELLGGLLKGPKFDGSAEDAVASCPVLRNTG
ncbi:hypothetical protein JHK87_015010 [Glycine soja]|nr:hypothetical protein JHK87_015010 [Glycine soja]